MRYFALVYHKVRLFVRKRDQGEQRWKQDQSYEWVPHTFHPRETQATKLNELGARPLLSLPQMASWWPGHSSSQCMAALGGHLSHRQTLGLGHCGNLHKFYKLSRYHGESLLSTWSHWSFRNGSISWAIGNESQLNYHPTWTVAFQKPSEVQACIGSWPQPLDKHIWTSSRSCAQGC